MLRVPGLIVEHQAARGNVESSGIHRVHCRRRGTEGIQGKKKFSQAENTGPRGQPERRRPMQRRAGAQRPRGGGPARSPVMADPTHPWSTTPEGGGPSARKVRGAASSRASSGSSGRSSVETRRPARPAEPSPAVLGVRRPSHEPYGRNRPLPFPASSAAAVGLGGAIGFPFFSRSSRSLGDAVATNRRERNPSAGLSSAFVFFPLFRSVRKGAQSREQPIACGNKYFYILNDERKKN